MSGVTALVVVTQGMGLKLLTLRANRACILKSYGIVANKETILNGLRGNLMALYLDQAQRKQAKNAHILVFLWKWPNYTLFFPSCCLKVWF